MKNNAFVFIFLFILLAILPVGGIYYESKQLSDLAEEYDSLEQTCVNSKADINMLASKKKVFTEALERLEMQKSPVKPSRDETAFYTALQQTARDHNVGLLSTQRQKDKKAQNASENVGNMTLILEGNYYDILEVFADWRVLPMTVKITMLTIRRGTTIDNVVADVNVETILAEHR